MNDADKQLQQYLKNGEMAKNNPEFSRGPGKTAVVIVQNGKPVKREKQPTAGVSEKQIQDAMAALLRYGWLVVRVNGGAMETEGGRYVRFCYWYDANGERGDGIPDLMAFRGDRYLLIEVKKPDKRDNLSQGQLDFQAAAIEVEASHYVLCSVEELEAVIG